MNLFLHWMVNAFWTISISYFAISMIAMQQDKYVLPAVRGMGLNLLCTFLIVLIVHNMLIQRRGTTIYDRRARWYWSTFVFSITTICLGLYLLKSEWWHVWAVAALGVVWVLAGRACHQYLQMKFGFFADSANSGALEGGRRPPGSYLPGTDRRN